MIVFIRLTGSNQRLYNFVCLCTLLWRLHVDVPKGKSTWNVKFYKMKHTVSNCKLLRLMCCGCVEMSQPPVTWKWLFAVPNAHFASDKTNSIYCLLSGTRLKSDSVWSIAVDHSRLVCSYTWQVPDGPDDIIVRNKEHLLLVKQRQMFKSENQELLRPVYQNVPKTCCGYCCEFQGKLPPSILRTPALLHKLHWRRSGLWG